MAETMDGYYLSGRKLACHRLEPAKAHPGLFDDADKAWRVIPWRRMERERRAAPKTEKDARKCLGRLLRGDGKRRQKLAQLGIDYEFGGYEAEAHLAAVKRRKDDPSAAPKAEAKAKAKATTAGAGAGGGKKRARTAEEEGGDAPAVEVVAATPKRAGVAGGEGKGKGQGGKKAKVAGASEPAEQRKKAPIASAAVASKKRGREAGEEAAPKANKAGGAKKGAGTAAAAKCKKGKGK